MTKAEIIETEATRRRAQAVPYAVATVVRTLAATSAKPGARALILMDGSIAAGWIGGGCARLAVAKAALAAIVSGQPQHVSLRPEELLEIEGVQAGEERDGIRFPRNGCPSNGSMDIFVQPVLPHPHLVILGAGPVAVALADLAARFDLHRTLAAPGLNDHLPTRCKAVSTALRVRARPMSWWRDKGGVTTRHCSRRCRRGRDMWPLSDRGASSPSCPRDWPRRG